MYIYLCLLTWVMSKVVYSVQSRKTARKTSVQENSRDYGIKSCCSVCEHISLM